MNRAVDYIGIMLLSNLKIVVKLNRTGRDDIVEILR